MLIESVVHSLEFITAVVLQNPWVIVEERHDEVPVRQSISENYCGLLAFPRAHPIKEDLISATNALTLDLCGLSG